MNIKYMSDKPIL